MIIDEKNLTKEEKKLTHIVVVFLLTVFSEGADVDIAETEPEITGFAQVQIDEDGVDRVAVRAVLLLGRGRSWRQVAVR